MYLIIDNTYLPCQLRLHGDDGSLRGKKDVSSMQDGVHEIIEGSSSGTIKKIKLERLIHRSIELFKPDYIYFEEKK